MTTSDAPRDADGISAGARPVVVQLHVPEVGLAEALDVMHRAFAEYSSTGKPSGALLETVETLADEVRAGTSVAVARLGGTAVGVAKHHATVEGHLYFGRLGVLPDARGRGVATVLVDALRASAHEAGLAGLTCLVRAEELGNIAVYERLGMTVVGRGERLSRTGALIEVVEMRDVA